MTDDSSASAGDDNSFGHQDGSGPSDAHDGSAETIQRATLDLISAARRFLDAAEDAVSDPERVASTVDASRKWLEGVFEGIGRFGSRATTDQPGGDAQPSSRLRTVPLED